MRFPWMGGTNHLLGVLGQDAQGSFVAWTDSDRSADWLRDFTVVGVVTRLLASRDEAIAFARERGIDWKPARQASE